MAQMLNQRGLRTRQGAEFQSSNIKRMIQHEGYTGYIITKAARSEFMPQLQIIDEALFAKANEMISKRSKKAMKDKNAAQKSSNPTLLAGIIVCAHCGAKMSAFLHTDRYMSTAPTMASGFLNIPVPIIPKFRVGHYAPPNTVSMRVLF